VSVLINADTLREALRTGTNTPTVLDVRWALGGPPGRNDYDKGHIPGAAYLDLDTDLCGPPGAGGRHPMPDPAVLQRALRGTGVTTRRPVVVYDGGDGMAAARAWWTLRWAGHPDVRVLDGGFPAWGGDLATDTPEPEPGDFEVRGGGMRVLDADEAALAAVNGVLIDARQPPRFRGEVEPIDAVAGHIPGARNVAYADLVQADGRFRTADELRARFVASGIHTGVQMGTDPAAYCGSGVTAAHTVLAMTLAGIRDPGLYVGSWSHWITDAARPIALGD
jgi:thiosulfate/3-mercaptopyruvate sulfurtransferase